ncbi:FecR domain-containing protein [Corallococcus sp. BB11-1]|uniref:FecR domain-containing protein n=1 Tax=Corallococcus sp. BB11-1 TaxID=2996783 RepID=UPI00226F4DEA|nr:FecR domain-containing protein [Corallococcus sp. BB11-1]MCY1032204.1 FecR domain-containing protein [Corallococcus sp. BB11-1]
MAAPSSRSRQVPFLVGVVLILAALPVGWFVFLREPPATPPVVAPAPAPVLAAAEPVAEQKVDLELSTFEGTVKVRRGADGEWLPAKKGMALFPTDMVSTGDGSYAVLVNGETFEVRMEAGTVVSVGELKSSLSKFLLDNGSATATVRGGKRHTFELKAGSSEVVASTDNGTFTMNNDKDKGTVRVGAREGQVKLSGKDKDRFVIVRAGQESIVRKGDNPTAPTPLPKSLLLNVGWPKNQLRERKLLVTGQTDPGNRVEVNGVVALPDEAGRFTTTVVLKEGSNDVKVSARRVGGLVETSQGTVQVDTMKPPIGVDPKSLWEETAGGAPP